MQAVRFHEHGDTSVLRVDEVPDPTPAADEVVIAVESAGVNPVDTYFRSGAYEPFTLPMIPGVDAAGVVETVGDEVQRVANGDRVVATGLGKDHFGGYADRVAIPTDRMALLPEGVDCREAGAAGVVAVTAWRALVDHGDLRPTEHCLIHGGSGGVGHAAVQIAAAAGANVITTAAPAYHDELAALGADVVLDYHRDDLADAVIDAADGGVDLTVDHRLDDYLQFDADVAAKRGRVVGIGENDPAIGFENDGAARSKDLSVQFMSMFNTPRLADPLGLIAALLGEGDLGIEIAETYSLEDAAVAQEAVLEESFLGKLAITP